MPRARPRVIALAWLPLPAVAARREQPVARRAPIEWERRAPSAAAPTMVPSARPASARKVLLASRGYLRCSFFGPVAYRVVIDAGQFDRFGVVSPKPLHQG